jgi:hypothetical protein
LERGGSDKRPAASPTFGQRSKAGGPKARENPAVNNGASTLASSEYRPSAPYLDELFQADGSPRPAAQALIGELSRLGPEGLIEAGRRRDAVFMQQGITFETSGENGSYGWAS